MPGHGTETVGEYATIDGMTSNAIDPTFTPPRPPLQIHGPGDLLAALPALLGFRPERSIVAVCLVGPGGRSLGTVMRHDFVPPDREGRVAPEMLSAFGQFVQVGVRERAAAVTVLIIDDSGLPAAAYTDALDVLAGVLADKFVPLAGAHFVTRLDAGSPWWSLLDGSQRGRLPDPETSGVALAHIVEGRRILPARADVEAQLEPGDRRLRAIVADAIPRPTGPRDERADADTRTDLLAVLALVERVSRGHRPTPREIADLGGVLDVDLRVRDSLLGLAAGPLAAAAETLWLIAARLLPDPHRAAAATLLGFTAYVRGDGPFAGICFAAALQSDANYRLAILLDASLTAGMRPDSLADLIHSATDVAAAVAVTLPPADPRR